MAARTQARTKSPRSNSPRQSRTPIQATTQAATGTTGANWNKRDLASLQGHLRKINTSMTALNTITQKMGLSDPTQDTTGTTAA